MALLKKTRGSQYPLHAEVVLNIAADTVTATDGTVKALKAQAVVAELIPLPPNATIVGGEIVVETASNDTGTSTMSVGDSASAARYLGATSLKAAARTALVPTGYRGVGEDIRLTLANANGDATAGKVTVRVAYVIAGRMQEVQAT